MARQLQDDRRTQTFEHEASWLKSEVTAEKDASFRFFAVVFCVVAAVKLLLLAYSGPFFGSDGYLRFAQTILADTTWWHDAQLENARILTHRWRMIGYPALIAAAIWAFGDAWLWALAVLQVIVSALAIGLFADLLRTATGSRGAAVFGAFAVATSASLIWDNFTLTDSLHASLLIIVCTTLAGDLLRRNKAASLRRAVLCGMALAQALLLRDVTLYLGVFMLPLVFLWARTFQPALFRTVAIVVVFYLPVAATAGLYMGWNAIRAGQPFLSTSSRTAVLVPLLRMAAAGEPVFDRDTPLDRAARRALDEIGSDKALASSVGVMEHVRATNAILTKEYGMDAVAIGGAASRRFIRVVATKPAIVLRYTATQLRPGETLMLFFQPVQSFTELYELGNDRPDVGALSSIGTLVDRISAGGNRFGDTMLLIGEAASRAVAILLAVTYLLVFPVFCFLSPGPGWRRVRTIWFACWLIPLGTALLYGMVGLEARYLMSAIPWAILVGIVTAKELWTGPWRRRLVRP